MAILSVNILKSMRRGIKRKKKREKSFFKINKRYKLTKNYKKYIHYIKHKKDKKHELINKNNNNIRTRSSKINLKANSMC